MHYYRKPNCVYELGETPQLAKKTRVFFKSMQVQTIVLVTISCDEADW
jgi:hypothetical protein